MEEFYEILGCKPDDNPETIRKAWLKQCLKHHPDHGGNKEDFLRIMHAFKMVSDPSYRMQQKAQPLKDLTLRVKIAVDFVEAFYGTRITVNYNQIELNHRFELVKNHELIPISIAFDIPAGSNGGFVYTEKGKGILCGGVTGDATIQVAPLSHDRYMVRGPDVLCSEKVPLDLILKGGEFVVDTLWGYRTIWVPPGTQPGQKIKVPGCGVGQSGYQYSKIEPIFPDESKLKTSTWSGLNINWQQAKDKNREDAELMAKFEELRKEKAEEAKK